MEPISISECLREGYEFFKKNMGLSIGGWFIYVAIGLVGGFIPFLNIIFAYFVSPALIGGLYKFYLNLSRDDNPRIDDIFFGFRRYGSMLGLFWLYILVIAVCAIPAILAIWGVEERVIPEAVGIIIAIANIIGIIFFLIRYVMVYWILIDEPRLGVFDALRESARITKGNYLVMIGLGLVSALIAIVSIILFVIPYIFAAQIIMIAWGRFYIKLRYGAAIPVEALPGEPMPPPGPPPNIG